ncbi:MAG TPA: response regulator [Bryobacterales bacterium]|nr:response regulator [Bryobacterales bacterium]
MTTQAKILLVDDDPVTLRILRKALETAGIYEIRAATDGAQGWDVARAFLPDLIISDKVMPNLDGLEFCRRVKGEPSLAATRFVILSAITDPEARAEGLEQGADDYLFKPMSFDEIQTRVRGFLEQQFPAAAPAPKASSAAPAGGVIEMLTYLVDLVSPGMANRAVQIAAAAEWMAESLDMPPGDRPHLHVAARLQEIGKLALAPGLAGGNPLEMQPDDWEAYRNYAGLSYLVMRHVEAFEPAAVVVRHQFENWDGSGRPDHLRQGQIPLGSRILRLLADFFGDLEKVFDVGRRTALLHELQGRMGAIYDPAVYLSLVQYVHQYLDAVLARAQRFVPVEELEPGMKLAADLITVSGALLLRENEILTPLEIQGILRYHLIDPITFRIGVYPPTEERA